MSVDIIDLATPETRAAALVEMLPMLIILASFMCSMYIAIDVTAGERERGSFEPLMLTPGSRLNLVLGKWAAWGGLGAGSAVVASATLRGGVGSSPPSSRASLSGRSSGATLAATTY